MTDMARSWDANRSELDRVTLSFRLGEDGTLCSAVVHLSTFATTGFMARIARHGFVGLVWSANMRALK